MPGSVGEREVRAKPADDQKSRSKIIFVVLKSRPSVGSLHQLRCSAVVRI